MARARSFAALPRFGRVPLAYALGVALLNMLIADQPYAAHLTLGPAFLESQAYWQPLSALFVYPEGQLEGLLGTFAIQWVLGTPVADRLGAPRYLALLAGAGVAGLLGLALLGLALPGALATPVGGSFAGDLGILVAFGVFFGRRTLRLFGVLAIRARTLVLILAALALLGPALRGHLPLVAVHGIAMATAWLVCTRPWRRGDPSGRVGKTSGGLGGMKSRKNRKKAKHLRVVH